MRDNEETEFKWMFVGWNAVDQSKEAALGEGQRQSEKLQRGEKDAEESDAFRYMGLSRMFWERCWVPETM